MRKMLNLFVAVGILERFDNRACRGSDDTRRPEK